MTRDDRIAWFLVACVIALFTLIGWRMYKLANEHERAGYWGPNGVQMIRATSSARVTLWTPTPDPSPAWGHICNTQDGTPVYCTPVS